MITMTTIGHDELGGIVHGAILSVSPSVPVATGAGATTAVAPSIATTTTCSPGTSSGGAESAGASRAVQVSPSASFT